MENNLGLKKPEFNEEIIARVKNVGEIESNMKEVKTYVEELNEYYKDIEFSEEELNSAIEEKEKVNKFKDQVSKYRKNIVAEYNKPIKVFEETAKETEKLLKDAYDNINWQVQAYRDKKKKAIEEEMRAYFEECKQSFKIFFLEFKDINLNITLSASKKSLKKQIKDFIDRINIDLATIALQENKEELLVEYKLNGYKLNEAIKTVSKRAKAIEIEKKALAEKQAEVEKQKQNETTNETESTECGTENTECGTESTECGTGSTEKRTEDILQAPEEMQKEEVLILKFTVRSTRTKLKELKRFLDNGGYDYE